MKISVIIPTLNEEDNISKVMNRLKECLTNTDFEIIVVDADSKDKTQLIAEKLGAKVIACNKMNRAYQMNVGAKVSQYDLLYFLHADAMPPLNLYDALGNSLREGADLGCFRFQFDSDRKILALNAYFTRFNWLVCRGGDQSLFIKRSVFEELGGYNADYTIMEEYDLIKRARKKYVFKVIPESVLVSARKYIHNSYLRVSLANFIVFSLYRFGASQESMIRVYFKLLNHPKAEAFQ